MNLDEAVNKIEHEAFDYFKAKKYVTPTGCWEIVTKQKRYPKLNFKGISFSLHILSAKVNLFGYNSRLFVCHKCDNNKCFNPEHLFIGTQSTNMLDCSRKGRHFSGFKVRSRRTHCKNGHEYTKDNTILYKGARLCIKCRKEANKKFNESRIR